MKADRDPVCTLTDDEKLRLCSIAINSGPFIYIDNRVVQFVPTDDFIQRDCFKAKVSFRTIRGLVVSAGRKFQEWMIKCDGTNGNARFEFLISRGYRDNHAYVYEYRRGRVYLLKQLSNVAVLRA